MCRVFLCACFRACLKCRQNALIGLCLIFLSFSFFFSSNISISTYFLFCPMQIHYLLSNGRISNGKLPTIGQIAGPLNLKKKNTFKNYIREITSNYHRNMCGKNKICICNQNSMGFNIQLCLAKLIGNSRMRTIIGAQR